MTFLWRRLKITVLDQKDKCRHWCWAYPCLEHHQTNLLLGLQPGWRSVASVYICKYGCQERWDVYNFCSGNFWAGGLESEPPDSLVTGIRKMLKLESFMDKWARNVSVESPMMYRSFNIGRGEEGAHPWARKFGFYDTRIFKGSFHGLCLLRENLPSLADSPPHSTLAAGPKETENSASPGGIPASLNHETCSRASSCHPELRVRFANTGLSAYLFLSTWKHCYMWEQEVCCTARALSPSALTVSFHPHGLKKKKKTEKTTQTKQELLSD